MRLCIASVDDLLDYLCHKKHPVSLSHRLCTRADGFALWNAGNAGNAETQRDTRSATTDCRPLEVPVALLYQESQASVGVPGMAASLSAIHAQDMIFRHEFIVDHRRPKAWAALRPRYFLDRAAKHICGRTASLEIHTVVRFG